MNIPKDECSSNVYSPRLCVLHQDELVQHESLNVIIKNGKQRSGKKCRQFRLFQGSLPIITYSGEFKGKIVQSGIQSTLWCSSTDDAAFINSFC